MKKTIRMGDLFFEDDLREKVTNIVTYKNLLIEGGYGAKAVDPEEIMAWLHEYGAVLKPFVCDVGVFLRDAHKAGRTSCLKRSSAALRDIVSVSIRTPPSSSTIAGICSDRCGHSGYQAR